MSYPTMQIGSARVESPSPAQHSSTSAYDMISALNFSMEVQVLISTSTKVAQKWHKSACPNAGL